MEKISWIFVIREKHEIKYTTKLFTYTVFGPDIPVLEKGAGSRDYTHARMKFAGSLKPPFTTSRQEAVISLLEMIGDPFVDSKVDTGSDHARGLPEARKIYGGREASPPRSTEEIASSGNIVLVEGNIGIGKTTLCRELSERLKYKAFFEPATENPYLEKFYANPKKYALQLQLWIFNQRCHTYVDALKHIVKTGEFTNDKCHGTDVYDIVIGEGVILDRSIYSDCVFAKVGRSEGYISEEGITA